MRVLSYDPELCVACRTCEEVCSETFYKTSYDLSSGKKRY
jgi:ferredoxin